MSFSSKLKDELVSLELSDKEKRALLMGMIQVNASINFNKNGLSLEFKTKNELVAYKCADLIEEFYSLEPILLKTKEVRLNKEDIFYVRLEQNALNVISDLKVIEAKEDTQYALKKELLTEEERLSYVRGSFLACGSINDPSSNTYHLEIQTFATNVAYNLRDLLSTYGIQSKISKNRRGYIVYLKSADKISDFIRILGSNDSLFYFEDYRIEKDLSNSINRVMNCEIANEKKSQEAAKRQLVQAKAVQKYYGERLKKSIKDVVILRINHPEDSLNELSNYSYKEVGKQLSKSALNHRFRDLQNVYQEIEEKSKD